MFEGDFLLVVGEILPQKHHEEGHGDVAHALDVAAGGVAVVPDEQESFEEELDAGGLAEGPVLDADPLDVDVDCVEDCLLVGVESVGAPVVAN